MEVRAVTSEMASNLTGGVWDSKTAGEDDTQGPQELPPDGLIKLWFSGRSVVPQKLHDALSLSRPFGYPILNGSQSKLTILGCETGSGWKKGIECRVKLNVGLVPGARYIIRLQPGASLNTEAGLTSKAIDIQVQGITPFILNLDGLRNTDKVSGRRFDFYLRLFNPNSRDPNSRSNANLITSDCVLIQARALFIIGTIHAGEP